MKRLEEYITLHAAKQADKLAVVCGNDRCSYAKLDRLVSERAKKLNEDGCLAGHVVCLRAESSIDFLVTYFALHRLGCVAAPLEKDLPEDSFASISAELSSHRCPSGTADVLYTTGTTGRSKGVMISHDTILADAENLIAGQGFTPELTFVINGPLNHIGSLSKVYPNIMLGATIVIVDGIKDLNRFFEAFEMPATKFASFLVPASIRILIQFSAKRLADLAPSIDFIETGAAAISESDMLALCQLLPNSRLYNTYASTETGIIATYDWNSGECTSGCLGRPMPNSQVFITEDGLIACKGRTLMTGYIGDPERTASILRNNTLYTSDIGTIDDKGQLHLKGREDDIINVGGFKVAPTEVEDAALSHPSIKDCICVAVPHKITGQALKLIVVLKDGYTLEKRSIALHLKQKLETFKIPALYETADAIRRTFNGKLDRKSYHLTP